VRARPRTWLHGVVSPARRRPALAAAISLGSFVFAAAALAGGRVALEWNRQSDAVERAAELDRAGRFVEAAQLLDECVERARHSSFVWLSPAAETLAARYADEPRRTIVDALRSVPAGRPVRLAREVGVELAETIAASVRPPVNVDGDFDNVLRQTASLLSDCDDELARGIAERLSEVIESSPIAAPGPAVGDFDNLRRVAASPLPPDLLWRRGGGYGVLVDGVLARWATRDGASSQGWNPATAQALLRLAGALPDRRCYEFAVAQLSAEHPESQRMAVLQMGRIALWWARPGRIEEGSPPERSVTCEQILDGVDRLLDERVVTAQLGLSHQVSYTYGLLAHVLALRWPGLPPAAPIQHDDVRVADAIARVFALLHRSHVQDGPLIAGACGQPARAVVELDPIRPDPRDDRRDWRIAFGVGLGLGADGAALADALPILEATTRRRGGSPQAAGERDVFRGLIRALELRARFGRVDETLLAPLVAPLCEWSGVDAESGVFPVLVDEPIAALVELLARFGGSAGKERAIAIATRIAAEIDQFVDGKEIANAARLLRAAAAQSPEHATVLAEALRRVADRVAEARGSAEPMLEQLAAEAQLAAGDLVAAEVSMRAAARSAEAVDPELFRLLRELRDGDELALALRVELLALHRAELARPSLDLRNSTTLAPPSSRHAESTAEGGPTLNVAAAWDFSLRPPPDPGCALPFDLRLSSLIGSMKELTDSRLVFGRGSVLRLFADVGGFPDPNGALVLEHMSANVDDHPIGGTSTISVEVNGYAAATFTVTNKSYVVDVVNVGYFLNPRINEIAIRFEEGPSRYWLHSVRLMRKYPPDPTDAPKSGRR
jgi:hypothetical protein